MFLRQQMKAWCRHRLGALLGVLPGLVLGGCATYPLMPTPALYTGPQARALFTAVPAAQRTPQLDLLYITDRAPAAGPDEPGPYTSDRSRFLAFGSTTVEFGDGVAWDALVAQSTTAKRTLELDLRLGATKELGRFPRIPYDLTVTPEGITRSAVVVAAHEAAKEALQTEIARRLALSPRKEVVLFVHGYNNSFEDAAFTMGELCHFLGREFVCAIFSWPAGGTTGAFFGYGVDRESGEFAAEDLKKTIRMIADTPGLEKLHLLAHSRGTDVLATALSDLSVEAYFTQVSLGRYKIENIVLIAPDIDIDVAPTKIWRIVSDPELPYGMAPQPRAVFPYAPAVRISMYVSPDDKALATSGLLFGSLARLGRINASTVHPEDIDQLRDFGRFDVIEVNATNCFICHSYFVSNPRVSADLIEVLRYGLLPNDPGRSLIELGKPFWRVPGDQEATTPR